MVESRTSVRDGLERSLSLLARDPAICPTIYEDSARAAADAADARRAQGIRLSPIDGVIITIKDLFDVAGETTRAGSPMLEATSSPAVEDAKAVSLLRAAGVVIVGKTNMSEFAFSGVGTNPHLGTPRNPLDPNRVPGGSSSGAAVAVASGVCDISLGSDTGGSLRIPAALCGVVGFKPSAGRISTKGAFPLSESFDCVGPIGKTVERCALADSVLAGGAELAPSLPDLQSIRLGVLSGFVQDNMDEAVASSFDAATACLRAAGASVAEVRVSALDQMREANLRGGIVAAEAYALHESRLGQKDKIDPYILQRIEKGASIRAADYIYMIQARRDLPAQWDRQVDWCDALLLPTSPIVAPTFAEVATSEGFHERNGLLLRNTAIANFFDLPAISIPLGASFPMCGLMLIGRRKGDARLLAIAAAVERAIAELKFIQPAEIS